MTYVEFFDKNAIENICTCLTDIPERVIFIGTDRDAMNAHIANYERVFKARGHNIEFICKTASKSNIDNAVRLLSGIVEEYEDVVFDITGGEKILALALGIVYEQHKDKNIQIHRVNINNNVVSDCDKDGKTVFKNLPNLTVEENIRIYGGDIVYGDIDDLNVTYVWDMTPEFEKDIESVWSVCKNNPKEWNIQAGIFEAICGAGECSADGLSYTAEIFKVSKYLSRGGIWFDTKQSIIKKLLKYDLLTKYSCSDEKVEISFKNEQVKKCITKAGQALEMKIYLTAKNLKDKEGNAVYEDAQNGVVIDWDGRFHDEETEHRFDTENEMDVMLMHGIVPVFVSCKNGKVSVDELYKLSTVAERFGGKYAKKVLAVTDFDMSGDAANYIAQRAADMRITVIDGVGKMSDERLCDELRTAWSR